MTTSGGLGENEVGGPAMNIIPKTGGNTFKYLLLRLFTSDALQGGNFTQRVKDAGLRAPTDQPLWDSARRPADRS